MARAPRSTTGSVEAADGGVGFERGLGLARRKCGEGGAVSFAEAGVLRGQVAGLAGITGSEAFEALANLRFLGLEAGAVGGEVFGVAAAKEEVFPLLNLGFEGGAGPKREQGALFGGVELGEAGGDFLMAVVEREEPRGAEKEDEQGDEGGGGVEDAVSYSAYFDDDVRRLYERAIAN